MNLNEFLNSNIFSFVVLPLLILISRIFDVTLGTIRIMLLSRGNRLLAPLLGFFEILIWLIAIRQIMQNLENIFCYIAYAGGFAIGNLLGVTIEQKVAIGKIIFRVVTRTDASKLVANLRLHGFGVTVLDAQGASGLVNVIYCIIDRKSIPCIIPIIEEYNPKAFYSIEDVRAVKEGIFPTNKNRKNKQFVSKLYAKKLFQRKSK